MLLYYQKKRLPNQSTWCGKMFPGKRKICIFLGYKCIVSQNSACNEINKFPIPLAINFIRGFFENFLSHTVK